MFDHEGRSRVKNNFCLGTLVVPGSTDRPTVDETESTQVHAST